MGWDAHMLQVSASNGPPSPMRGRSDRRRQMMQNLVKPSNTNGGPNSQGYSTTRVRRATAIPPQFNISCARKPQRLNPATPTSPTPREDTGLREA